MDMRVEGLRRVRELEMKIIYIKTKNRQFSLHVTCNWLVSEPRLVQQVSSSDLANLFN